MPRAKTAIPRVPPNLVPRNELRDRLDEFSTNFPVTLVCAPAGYGKTLLLADWIEKTGAADKALVSLDSGDNDAGRFWTAVLSALRGCVPVPTSSRLHTLRPPESPDAGSFCAEIIDGLAALPAPIYLVLDDLQEVISDQTWHGIATLVRHQPGNLRFVLSTRADPRLPLARLRMQGGLAELRAADLRLSTSHAVDLLDRAGVRLDADQVRRLAEATDGWPAGLRLAARSLRDAPDPEAFLTEFAGNDRAIADFLVSEVLARFPAPTIEVLTAVSMCEEVTPALAAALSKRADAGAILADLERESSLVLGVGSDRQWLRTHPLLRAYLLADLARRRPAALTELHETAAAWFARQELPNKAFDHVALSGENRAKSDLLRRNATGVLMSGDDHGVVRRALESLGADVVRWSPSFALISALAHVQAGDHDLAKADVAACRAAWPATPDANLLRLRQLVLTTRALAGGGQPPAESLDWRNVVVAYEGVDLEAWARLGYGWTLLRRGDPAGARRELEAAARLARRYELHYVTMHCLFALATLYCQDGAFPAMESMSEEAVGLAYAHAWTTSPWLCGGHLMIGLARLQSLDPDAALDHARRAAATLPAGVGASLLRYAIDLITGMALVDLGRRQEGLTLLRQARHDHGGASLPVPLLAAGALIEQRCALALGHEGLAQQLMVWARERIGAVPELALMQATASFAHGALHDTENALHAVLDDHRSPLCPPTRLEARLLETALEIRRGRRTKARGTLDAALELAEPASLIRPFHHADPRVRQLLLEQVGGFGRTNAFADRVSQLVSTVDIEPERDVLTTREHAVLSRLSSPQSLDELATDMAVSVNTVKTHVRAIYAKLGVNSRRAAVVAGRQLGFS